MPLPLSLTLTARVRRLLPIIERGVASGLSSRAINTAITTATGTGIRRQVLLDVMRDLRGVQTAGEALRFVRLDRVPNPLRVPTALTPIRRAFGSTVRIEGTLLGTGERVTRFIQVTHDSVLTRGEIEDIASGFFDEDEDEQFDSTSGVEMDSALLVRQVRRA